MSNPSFPELSRRPALKTKTSSDDPTLRDSMENGMETTRARYTRRRRTWSVTLEHLTNDDVTTLEQFVVATAVYGAVAFIFCDNRDPSNPASLLVRFSKIPEYDDEGWIGTEFRQKCMFEIREV